MSKFSKSGFDRWTSGEATITKGSQSLNYYEALTYGDYRDPVMFATFQIRIKSDSYRQQCYCMMDRWDGTKWQRIATLSPGEMQTPEGLNYHRHGTNNDAYIDFADDRDHLIRRAIAVSGMLSIHLIPENQS